MIVNLYLQQLSASSQLLPTLVSYLLKHRFHGAALFYSMGFVNNGSPFNTVSCTSKWHLYRVLVSWWPDKKIITALPDYLFHRICLHGLLCRSVFIINFACFFVFNIMNISWAEAVVATSLPWVAQSRSACLVEPYVDLMTQSELHLIMASSTCYTCPFFLV